MPLSTGLHTECKDQASETGISQRMQTTERKIEIIDQYKQADGDTGSPEVQVALLTDRIIHLTNHLREHKHDFSTRRGLLKLVGQRRRQLRYLASKDVGRYHALIQSLGLRR